MYFFLEALLIAIPLVIFFYLISLPGYFLALYVPFNIFFFMDRFILILHNISHRPLFRKKYRALNYFVVWILGPLFGEAPETYFVHHIGMHHVEGNLESDLSSTMQYDRDSFKGWFRYFLRFFFGTIIDMSLYMKRTSRRKLLLRFVVGELSFYIFIVFLCAINFGVTFFVFILPFILCRFAMIAGNWAQHAFIDPLRPDDPFTNSITLINCRYNRRCFNDGYHIGHHLKPRLHWTEMPKDFETNKESYRKRDAIVFEGIDFIVVWGLLMIKRYDILAKHFVDLRSYPRSHTEVVEFLKSRTKKMSF
jgi:fatty acid desaturase